MVYAVGDAHTNLLNPFCALPLLAITGIDAREMFGYALVLLLVLIVSRGDVVPVAVLSRAVA